MKLSQLLSLISRLADEKGISTPFICGGLPRDKVLGLTSNLTDIDLTTGDQGVHYLAKEIAIKLRLGNKYLTMPDGHATLMVGGLKLDFSSNFIVPNIDSILAKQNITNPTSMQEELYSRDFTCNSLLMSMDLKNIFDPLNRGLKDIENRVIKTCLDPAVTLGYDNKRVVRVLYLAAKLNFDVAPEVMKWIKDNPSSLSNVKPKYLINKLNKAVEHNTEKVVQLVEAMQLWPYVPPVKALEPYMLRNTKRM
jgi:poly(A) polymerase